MSIAISTALHTTFDAAGSTSVREKYWRRTEWAFCPRSMGRPR